MPAAQGSLFDHTIHFSAGWVRASIEHGVHAVGSVSAYICGRQTFLGRPINNPHAAGEIAFSGLSLPSNVEFNAETLWVRMDACERKADGSYRRYGGQMPRVASHIDAALPWGLSEAQARHIVEGFARWLTSTYGVGVQYGCHNQDEPYDHAHFLMSTRSLDAERAGKKVREMNGIAMQHMDRAEGRAITHERDDGSVKSVSSFMDGLRAEWARRIGEERGSTPCLPSALLRQFRGFREGRFSGSSQPSWSADETEIGSGESTGRAGREGHPPSDAPAVLGRREDPHR
ncbi:MAG: MobA/MobL family protein, partial [Bosea sp. (in: a-proteobacteria)]